MSVPDLIPPLGSPAAELMRFLKSDRETIFKDGHNELFVARAPGSLDLMGGITDYAGGMACQYPLAGGAAVALQRRDDRKLIIKSYTAGENGGPAPQTVTLSLDDFYGSASLLPQETMQALFSGGQAWAAQVAGAFPMLARHKKITGRTHGANIACYSNLPQHAGAGDAAALACATLWAMTAAYHLILDPMEIAFLAQRIENQIGGVPSGIAAFAAAALGKKDQVMVLECQPHEVKEFSAVPTGTFVAGIYTGKGYRPGEGYRPARVSAFMAHAIIARLYRDLGVKKDPTRGFLANVSPDLLERYFTAILPEYITGADFVKQFEQNGDRVVPTEPEVIYAPRGVGVRFSAEMARTRIFADGLRALQQLPDARAGSQPAVSLGEMMFKTHEHYSAATGLGSTEADLLVTLIQERGAASGFLGARLSGAEAPGMVAVLADETPAVRQELAVVLENYRKRTGLTPHLLEGSAPGACETAPIRVSLADMRA